MYFLPSKSRRNLSPTSQVLIRFLSHNGIFKASSKKVVKRRFLDCPRRVGKHVLPRAESGNADDATRFGSPRRRVVFARGGAPLHRRVSRFLLVELILPRLDPVSWGLLWWEIMERGRCARGVASDSGCSQIFSRKETFPHSGLVKNP